MDAKKMGRPAKFGVKMRRVCVTLDDHTIEEAKRIGSGKLSEGIRKAINRHPQAVAPAAQETQGAAPLDTFQPQSAPI